MNKTEKIKERFSILCVLTITYCNSRYRLKLTFKHLTRTQIKIFRNLEVQPSRDLQHVPASNRVKMWWLLLMFMALSKHLAQ